jgi:hypothetical protein
MRRKLDLNADIIDSRDITDRLNEVIEEIEGMEEEVEENRSGDVLTEDGYTKKYVDKNEYDELVVEKEILERIYDQGRYIDDWEYGVGLIAERYFVEYCIELVSDIGDLPRDIPNYLVIDWEATAENLKQDYTEIDIDGTTYYVR